MNHNTVGLSTKSRISYFIWVVIFFLLIGAIVFLMNTQKPVSDDMTWYSAHTTNGKTYFGQLKSTLDGEVVFKNPYRFDSAKSISDTSASSTPFSIQQIENWYSITPVSKVDPVTLSKDGSLVFENRELLFWGPLNENTELTRALIKANEGK